MRRLYIKHNMFDSSPDKIPWGERKYIGCTTTLIMIRSDEIMSSTIRYTSHITFVSVY